MVSRLWLWRWVGRKKKWRMERKNRRNDARNGHDNDNDTSFPSGSTSHHQVHQSLWPCKSFADSGAVVGWGAAMSHEGMWTQFWGAKELPGPRFGFGDSQCCFCWIICSKQNRTKLLAFPMAMGPQMLFQTWYLWSKELMSYIGFFYGWIQWNWLVISLWYLQFSLYTYTLVRPVGRVI